MVPTGRWSVIDETKKAVSKRLVFAYAFDWTILIVLGVTGFGLTFITPHFRPFSLLDLSISFPYEPETISISVLAAACVLAPAAIIAITVVLFVPGPTPWKQMSAGEILRIKIWELNVGWLGLALAHATQFLIVQGVKTLVGKPRPNLLDRCQPDLANINKYIVGAYGGQDISSRWSLVDQSICTTSKTVWVDGFRSFPSGHSSTAFAGMLYLSLYLASKFGVGFPVLPFHKRDIAGTSADKRSENKRPMVRSSTADASASAKGAYRGVEYRDEAAGPPMWTVLMVYIPLAVAVYIGTTRFFDFYHHGFDILSSSVIGLLCGWFAFRWYHGPLGRCAGWAWGPRSRDRAFGIGVGTLGYVSSSIYSQRDQSESQDVELGTFPPAEHPRIRPGWQREDYESLRSSVNEDRRPSGSTPSGGNYRPSQGSRPERSPERIHRARTRQPGVMPPSEHTY